MIRRLRHAAGAALIVVAVAWALGLVMRREVAHAVDDTVEIRFSHEVLDPGFRQAMRRLGAEYELLQAGHGKKVKVIPIEIPHTVYTQWARTQLLGRTAPDIMMINFEMTREPDLIARHFRAMSDVIDQPNAYNAGTVHEGVPWRATYFDGMRISGYIFPLADHYGFPIFAQSLRMVANRRLLAAILAAPANAALAHEIGPSLVPRTFDQFIALCDAVKPWSEQAGVPLFPIAANKESGRFIVDHAVRSQNQRLLLTWPHLKEGRVTENTFLRRLDRSEPVWSDPAFREGLEVLREIGLRTQPGFLQLRREDSNFAFATGRALMTFVSSQDASSLRAMTGDRIETVAFPIPWPMPGHARFGRHAFGSLSEAEEGGRNPFGIVADAPPARQEQALDFLRFLTSFNANQTFTRLSGLLPAIDRVEPGPAAAPFAIRPDGYPPGPTLYMGLNDVRNLLDTYLYLAVSPQGSVDRFLAEAPPALTARAVTATLKSSQDAITKISRRQDSVFGAYYWLKTFAPEARADAERKLGILLDSSDGNESDGAMRGPRLEWYARGQR